MTTDKASVGQAAARPERRQLTIVFADFEASTELATRTDPEAYAQLTADAQGRIAETIESAGGTVAKLMGDGLLAYFGAPFAHEDDAFRAVAAALDFTARLQEGATAALAVRTGIHTGLVVVGPVQAGQTRHERDVLGAAPSIAARIQSAAGPNEVVVSPSTEELIRDRFRSERLPPRTLRGVAGPMALYRVIGLREDVELEPTAALAPFLGRKRDMRTLTEAWEDAQEGEGRVCVVSGEPGIGKSRLKREFLRASKLPPGQIVRWNCRESRQTETFWAVEDWLRREAAQGAESSESPGAAALLELLGAGPESTGGGAVTADRFHQDVVERVRARLVERAANAPLCLVVDDVQWADRGTLDVLANLIDTPRPPAALFILALHRTPFAVPWQPRAHVQTVVLNRLGRAAAEAIVAAVARDSLPAADVEGVLAGADGVPLFLEELSRHAFDEHGYRALQATDAAELPTRLATLLTARLDALGEARTAARFAAVLGDSFTIPQLAEVMQAPLASITEDMRVLEGAGICYRQPTLENQYGFRHRLIRDAAYNVLSLAERTRIHGRVADELGATLPPQTLATHLARAHRPDEAIGAYLQAIQQAAGRHRWHQAAAIWHEGMSELAGAPETLELARFLSASSWLASILPWSELHAASSRALAIFESHEEPVAAARERLNLAATCCSVSDGPFSPPTALKHLDRAAEILSAKAAGLDRVMLHVYRSEAYRLCGDPRADHEVGVATEMAEALGHPSPIGLALLSQGMTEFHGGAPERGHATWRRGIALAATDPTPDIVGLILTILMERIEACGTLHEYEPVLGAIAAEIALNRQSPASTASLQRVHDSFRLALGERASDGERRPPAARPGIVDCHVLLNEGRLGEARDTLRAHALRMRSAGALGMAAIESATVGLTELLLGRPASAIDELAGAVAAMPETFVLWRYIARAYAALAHAMAGDAAAADRELIGARAILPAPSAYFRGVEEATEALIRAEQGNAEGARRRWEDATGTLALTGLLMDRALARRVGAHVLARVGDTGGACRALESVPTILAGHGWSDDWETACRMEADALGVHG